MQPRKIYNSLRGNSSFPLAFFIYLLAHLLWPLLEKKETIFRFALPGLHYALRCGVAFRRLVDCDASSRGIFKPRTCRITQSLYNVLALLYFKSLLNLQPHCHNHNIQHYWRSNFNWEAKISQDSRKTAEISIQMI